MRVAIRRVTVVTREGSRSGRRSTSTASTPAHASVSRPSHTDTTFCAVDEPTPPSIIAASIRHPVHVIQAAESGAHIATVPFKVIKQMVNHPLTDKGVERFLADWEKAQREAARV